MITFAGRQDNVAVREAAMFAFGANLLMVVAAIVVDHADGAKGQAVRRSSAEPGIDRRHAT